MLVLMWLYLNAGKSDAVTIVAFMPLGGQNDSFFLGYLLDVCATAFYWASENCFTSFCSWLLSFAAV